MKRFLRWCVRRIVDLADRHLCTTYGDSAELHRGPCERCVGHAVVGAFSESQSGE